MLLEINGRRLRAWVHLKSARVERLVIFRPDFEAIAHKRQPMSDKVIGYFAVLFRFCRDPSSLQLRFGCLSRQRIDKDKPGYQPTQRRGSPLHDQFSQRVASFDGSMFTCPRWHKPGRRCARTTERCLLLT